ncbi:uncharacterized protein B0P05DRAFT_557062 [Gilbertella persicaria]|nr:uncharacterized protein B0P05DRAFT_557062 [Gilbertella persicaria]KAI8061870.1 hypothetical protein B0P05DRAFT_557062 [Gilbertella persicaria]
MNEFISHSPGSSSSVESNLISSPQYLVSTRRSSSVPPHLNTLKPHSQDSSNMYNQPQVTQTTHPLPIQIQRVLTNHQPAVNRTIDPEEYRRQLDEKLEKVNFDDITVAELKELLRERGLSAMGRKADLWNRLKEEYDLLMSRKNGSPAAALPRRLSNLNLGSPKRQPRLFSPYSPPKRLSSEPRLASSVPDHHTSSYLNEQFMRKRPSSLRKSIQSEQSKSPPISDDIWDDQTLEKFLREI